MKERMQECLKRKQEAQEKLLTCSACTFINVPGATQCAICENPLIVTGGKSTKNHSKKKSAKKHSKKKSAKKHSKNKTTKKHSKKK
jgi:hypothetical protein